MAPSWRRLAFGFLLVVGFAAGISPSAGQTRLAIVSGNELAAAAALLTVEFSQQPNFVTLERAELNKIVRERALESSGTANALAAARTLGADALLFMEPARLGTNRGALLRLVAANAGAVAKSSHLPWPVEDADRWARNVVEQYRRAVTGIGQPADKLVKLSVLNLRSPSASPAAQSLDREIATLLKLHLSGQPGLLLLDRQDMGDLAFEKELAASTEKFLASAYLLDGTVNRDETRPGVVTLDLRLAKPSGGHDEFRLEGARANVASLAQKAVAETLKRVSLTPSAPPLREAAAYLEEAQWALRWGMNSEARSAADAAWSLGLQSIESATTRLLACARLGNRYDYRWNISTIDRHQITTPVYPPNAAELPFTIESLGFARELLNRSAEAVANQPFYLAVCESAALAGDLLHKYYFQPEAREGHEEDLATVRRYCREITKSLMANPRVQPNNREVDASRISPFAYLCNDIFAIAATYAVFFSETPEETAQTYRDLINDHPTPRVRRAIERRNLLFVEIPLFGGWKWDDRKRARDVLEKFAAEVNNPRTIGSLFAKHASGSYRNYQEYASSPAGKQSASLPAGMPIGFAEALEGLPPEMRAQILERRAARTNAANVASALPPGLPASNPRPRNLTNLPPGLVAVGFGQSVPMTEPVTTAAFWQVPTNLFRHPNIAMGSILSPIFRKGEVWFRYSYSYHAAGPFLGAPSIDAALVAVNPETFEARAIPLDHESLRASSLRLQPMHLGEFEVTDKFVFVIKEDLLVRRDLARNEWATFPLPAGGGRLFLVHDKLYLSARESIYDLGGDGASSRALASARRRPATTPLDELETLDMMLGPGPGGSLRAWNEERQFRLENNRWHEELSFPKNARLLDAIFPIFKHGLGVINGLIWTDGSSSKPELLGASPGYKPEAVTEGRKFPLAYEHIARSAAFLYENSPALVNFQTSAAAAFWRDQPLRFIFFPKGATGPAHVPIHFPKAQMTANTTMGPSGEAMRLFETDAHLVVVGKDFNGIWRVPKKDINARIQQALAARSTGGEK